MRVLRLLLPFTAVASSLACSPGNGPWLLATGWQSGYIVPAFSQDEETAFVVVQSHERDSVLSTSYARSEFVVAEHAFRTDGAITDVHAEAIPGTALNLFPREETGWLLLDGMESGDADDHRALWRIDMSGETEQLESLPPEIWTPSFGEWTYLASPDGHQIARIFHRHTFDDQSDEDVVESLTGLTVPPLGLVVTLLDALSGAELFEPVVLQAPNPTRAGRPSAYPYWQTNGTVLLTDGVNYAREIGLDGTVSEVEVPSCLHVPTPRWVSQAGETLTVSYDSGEITVGMTDEAPFGCP